MTLFFILLNLIVAILSGLNFLEGGKPIYLILSGLSTFVWVFLLLTMVP